MILEYKVSDIKRLLISRAKATKTIKYSEIYNIFTSEEINVKRDIWDTFEEACNQISTNKEAIYGSLLQDKSGLPQDGFFDIYAHIRYDEYEVITGDRQKNTLYLSFREKEEIVQRERKRVYHHVSLI